MLGLKARDFVRKAGALLAGAVFVGMPVIHAQTYTYTDTSSTPLNETVASCAGTPIAITYSVTQTDTIGDVRLSLLATHTYRGDIEAFLTSPAGTQVQLAARDGGRSGDNLNVTFDDAATSTYAASSDTITHATTASGPPYEYTFSPNDALSAFDGETMNGTWTLEICDAYNQDSGDYQRSDLELDVALPSADLSLGVSETVSNPATGTSTDLTFTVTNGGPEAATGVQVTALLPSGLSYVSDDSSGAYDQATGVWTIAGNLASGNSTTLTITALANATGSGSILAEVTASDLNDPNSTPDNRNTAPTEDDTASTTILINGPPPGTPPTLSCPVATTTFDWDSNAWSAGTLTTTYTAGVGLDFTFSGDTSTLVNNTSFGGQTPLTSNVISGGLSPAEQALLFVVNYASSSQQLQLNMDVGTAGEGVESLQFTVFDVDINPDTGANANFIDRLRIFGYLSGTAVTPILTDGSAFDVSGSTAIGVAAVASTSGDGNLVVTFDAPVDQVLIYYDNDPAVASDPGQQGVAIHDITYCERGRDYSDAPAAYGTPSHLITSGYRIGSVEADRDSASQPGTGADGDDTNGTDDEDGLTWPSLATGDSTTLSVPVSGSGGYLQAWIDWDGDSSFEASEQVATDLQTATGTVSIPISVPATATTSQTYARLRWSSQAGLSADGDAPDGEVEDYAVSVSAGATMSCPAGFTLTTQAGNADQVIVDAFNGSTALGAPEAVGTTASNDNSARLTNSQNTLILDMTDLVAEGASITVTLARNNNSGDYNIDLSPDNVSYTNITTFSGGTVDSLGTLDVTVPTAGARYIRFQRNGGSLWVGGLAYSDICTTGAALEATKTTALYDPLSEGLFAVPGNDVIYTITVTNTGSGSADTDSIELIDAMPASIEFYNADTPEFGNAVIGWNESSSNLTFDQANDVAYSDASGAPADFTACTYTPSSGYDPNITYICFNPKGAMAAGDPDPSFSVSFRARIR